MPKSFYPFSKALRTLRLAVGKKDIPAIWLEFFLIVADAEPKGITTQEVIEELDLTQGIASRIVKMLSKYYDPIKKEQAGYDLFVTAPDHFYRHRQRVFLSDFGKSVATKLMEHFK